MKMGEVYVGRYYQYHARKRVKLDYLLGLHQQQHQMPWLRQSVGLFDVPDEVRYRILGYLDDERDFASYAACSIQCYKDCKQPELPLAATTFTVIAVEDPSFHERDIENLLRKLFYASRRGIFWEGSRLKRMKLIGHGGLRALKHDFAKRYLKGTLLSSVTSLDISLSQACNKTNRKVTNCLIRYLAQMLPNLMEVDLGHCILFPSAFSEFGKWCPELTKLTANGAGIDFLAMSGLNFSNCENLREIHLDNADFWFSAGFGSMIPEEAYHNYFMKQTKSQSVVLDCIQDRIEKVSLVDATFYGECALGGFEGGHKPLTQIGLIKFVKNAKKLRWFRSNLSPKSISVLKSERPDVEFVSPR